MKEGAWSLTKLQRACSSVCTTLCMLELEGKQRFPLKAVTGLSESYFHRLHGYQQIFFFFFFLAKVPAALPLFILLIAARGRKEIISLGSCSLVSRWCILICSGYFTAAYSHHWADSQTGEQTAALGTLFLSHPQAEPASGLWAQGPAKQRSSRRQASLLFRILLTELSLANQSPHGNQGTPRYKG